MGGTKIKSDGGCSYNKGGGGHFGKIRDSGSKIVIHRLPGLLTLLRLVGGGWGTSRHAVILCHHTIMLDSI